MLRFTGNYWVEDLYSDDPNGRYWYQHGFHWRAYAAYLCGVIIPFPGFIGSIGVKSLAGPLNPAAQIYSFGYLLAFVVGGFVYYVLCKLSPPPHVQEARNLPFESMGMREVLIAISSPVSVGPDHDLQVETSEQKMGSSEKF